MLFSLPDKKAALTNYLQRKMPQTILLQESTDRDSPAQQLRGPFASRFNGKCLLMIRPTLKTRTKRAARYKQKQGASFT
ncbi:hypothetical protein HMPREF3213_01250 [Heyndrickxia coagulans]|uniref:Uncharacterized protein n=1 Tax=Heyndrickxia coagulans TaxID=1398 RepID=A0A133KV30_HEYCO|nr:hypothetical protein HMPREF3213_01250 [Heyndrickxia coagulans]